MSEREKLEAAVGYFEEAVRESDEILEQCSDTLRRELTEQKEHFVVALEAMRQVLAWDWVPVAERRCIWLAGSPTGWRCPAARRDTDGTDGVHKSVLRQLPVRRRQQAQPAVQAQQDHAPDRGRVL